MTNRIWHIIFIWKILVLLLVFVTSQNFSSGFHHDIANVNAQSAPTLVASPTSGPKGTGVSFSGTGYNPNYYYVACFNPSQNLCAEGGSNQVRVLSDSQGNIAGGIAVANTSCEGLYGLVVVPSGNVYTSAAFVPFMVTVPGLSFSTSTGSQGTTISMSAPSYTPCNASKWHMCLSTSATAVACLPNSDGTGQETSSPTVFSISNQLPIPTASGTYQEIMYYSGLLFGNPALPESIILQTETFTVVNPTFDFSFKSPPSIAVAQNAPASELIGVDLVSGSGTVSLSAQGSCASGYSFSPNSGSPSFSSTLSFTASGSAGSSCTITVTGTGTGTGTSTSSNPVHSTSFTLTLLTANAPFDFTISSDKSSYLATGYQSVLEGWLYYATGTINVGSVNGYGSVTLAISGPCLYVDPHYGSPNYVSPSQGTVPFSSSFGAYIQFPTSCTVTVTATGTPATGYSGNPVHSVSFTVVTTGISAFDFTLSNLLPMTVTQGYSATQTVNVGFVSGSGTVSLSAQGSCASGYSFSPNSGSPSFSSTLSFTASGSAGSSCTITVTGTSSLVHTTYFTLTVSPPPPPFDFSMPTVAPLSTTQNSFSSTTLTIGLVNAGTSGTVSLSAQSTCASAITFTPTSGSPPFSSVMTYQATGAVGSICQITATGASGSLAHATGISLTITSPAYTLTVISAQGKLGNPNYYGITSFQQGQTVQLSVTSPANITAETRWTLQGYSIDGGSTLAGSSLSLTLNQGHSVTWIWQKQVQVVLRSNLTNWSQYIALNGAGWQLAGSTTQLQAPQSVTIGSTTWYFKQWKITSGKGTFSTDFRQGLASVILQSDPTFEADYSASSAQVVSSTTSAQVVSSTTSGFFITFTNPAQATGVQAIGPASIGITFLIIDRNSAKVSVTGANITVVDYGTGRKLWSGISDANGYAPSEPTPGVLFTPNERYWIYVQRLGYPIFKEQLSADVGGTKAVDLSQNPGLAQVPLDTQILASALVLILFIAGVVWLGSVPLKRWMKKHKTMKKIWRWR